MQFQPAPDIDTRVKPEGRVSVTVTAPIVGPAFAAFETVTVYVAFCWPWVKLPVWVLLMLRIGPVLVSEKMAGLETPGALAVTVYDPTVLLAVKAGDVACPLAPVVAVAVGCDANEPPGPLAGAVNVTVTPETGLPPESFTTATNGLANAPLICAL